ncbi:MAG: protein tyrosine phosphatase, partial [Myxococcales bacterium]
MSGYIDLHAHWVPGIDDGVTSVAEGVELLRGLASIGFSRAVATPHMRPGMFDNSREVIEGAFARMVAECAGATGLPELGVASEHYLDDVVYQRLLDGKGVPLPGGQAVLVELHADIYPVRLADRVLDLRRRKLRPVIAHPERYAAVADRAAVLDEALDAGAAL